MTLTPSQLVGDNFFNYFNSQQAYTKHMDFSLFTLRFSLIYSSYYQYTPQAASMCGLRY